MAIEQVSRGLIIETSTGFQDSVHLRRGDVEPTLQGNTLTVYEGRGRKHQRGATSRVWGEVVLQGEDLVAVHVGFASLDSKGQFWRFFQPTAGTWQRVKWTHLTDRERRRVRGAATLYAPHWAKSPGKLRSEYAPRTVYDIVRRQEQGSLSPYAPASERAQPVALHVVESDRRRAERGEEAMDAWEAMSARRAEEHARAKRAWREESVLATWRRAISAGEAAVVAALKGLGWEVDEDEEGGDPAELPLIRRISLYPPELAGVHPAPYWNAGITLECGVGADYIARWLEERDEADGSGPEPAS